MTRTRSQILQAVALASLVLTPLVGGGEHHVDHLPHTHHSIAIETVASVNLKKEQV